MPDEQAHLAAYNGHLAACRDTTETHPDWAAVMLFYCAVHQVERLLAVEGHHSCEHAERELAIKTGIHSIWADYRALKSESLKTRYLEGGVFKLTSPQVQKKLVPRLDRIRADIDARISARKITGL